MKIKQRIECGNTCHDDRPCENNPSPISEGHYHQQCCEYPRVDLMHQCGAGILGPCGCHVALVEIGKSWPGHTHEQSWLVMLALKNYEDDTGHEGTEQSVELE